MKKQKSRVQSEVRVNTDGLDNPLVPVPSRLDFDKFLSPHTILKCDGGVLQVVRAFTKLTRTKSKAGVLETPIKIFIEKK